MDSLAIEFDSEAYNTIHRLEADLERLRRENVGSSSNWWPLPNGYGFSRSGSISWRVWWTTWSRWSGMRRHRKSCGS